jgi:hypothetical protein
MLKMSLLFLLLFPRMLISDHCWKIRSDDRRALCEAKFEHKNRCWQIKDNDLRAYCEATAEGKRSCWKIKEADMQAMCEAEQASR